MWASRYGKDGLKITANQSTGMEAAVDDLVAGRRLHPAELAARIQNEDNSVPTATMTAAKKCAHCGTSLRPNSSTPRKLASRKNAVSPS